MTTLRIHPQMPVALLADALRTLSTNTHEACLEVYGVEAGLSFQVRMVPRDDIAPDFIRVPGTLQPYQEQ